LLLNQTGIRPIITAQVDDMSMHRLMARETNGMTLVPPVVVKDRVESGALAELQKFHQIKKRAFRLSLRAEDSRTQN
jgi:LysR family transcriptional activator of nhaA